MFEHGLAKEQTRHALLCCTQSSSLSWFDLTNVLVENLNYTLPRAKFSHLLGRVLNKERIIFQLFQGGYTFWWTDMALAIPQLSIGGTSSFMARFPGQPRLFTRSLAIHQFFWNFGNFGDHFKSLNRPTSSSAQAVWIYRVGSTHTLKIIEPSYQRVMSR